MKPDRSYDLDLAHRDDREVCKVMQGVVRYGTRSAGSEGHHGAVQPKSLSGLDRQ